MVPVCIIDFDNVEQAKIVTVRRKIFEAACLGVKKGVAEGEILLHKRPNVRSKNVNTLRYIAICLIAGIKRQSHFLLFLSEETIFMYNTLFYIIYVRNYTRMYINILVYEI